MSNKFRKKSNKLEKTMSKPPPSVVPLIKQLTWHCLMGVALGVLCAGLLLQIDSSHSDALIHGADTMAARFRFLLTVAFFFGAGATLTGATFLANDNERSRSS
jgi:cytochrome bd-type quinol oxidase subunit 2